MPEVVRCFITTKAMWFFDEASYKHHDFGYYVGHREIDRWRCDWKFFVAMLRDSLRQPFYTRPFSLIISTIFFVAVLVGGWYDSFCYGPRYRTIDEVLSLLP